MTTRAEIVAEARSWVGTRWHHQASLKGVGTDCVGLVRGVYVNVGLLPSDFWENQAQEFHGYSRLPSGQLLEAGFDRWAKRITFEQAQPGDTAMINFGGRAHHVAIFGDYPAGGLSIIHAYAQARQVVESRVDDQWRARIMWAYTINGVEP